MPQYAVKLMFDFRTQIVVEADDVYEANAKAEALVGELYTVYNSDTETHESFESITGYDPEEVI